MLGTDLEDAPDEAGQGETCRDSVPEPRLLLGAFHARTGGLDETPLTKDSVSDQVLDEVRLLPHEELLEVALIGLSRSVENVEEDLRDGGPALEARRQIDTAEVELLHKFGAHEDAVEVGLERPVEAAEFLGKAEQSIDLGQRLGEPGGREHLVAERVAALDDPVPGAAKLAGVKGLVQVVRAPGPAEHLVALLERQPVDGLRESEDLVSLGEDDVDGELGL